MTFLTGLQFVTLMTGLQFVTLMTGLQFVTLMIGLQFVTLMTGLQFVTLMTSLQFWPVTYSFHITCVTVTWPFYFVIATRENQFPLHRFRLCFNVEIVERKQTCLSRSHPIESHQRQFVPKMIHTQHHSYPSQLLPKKYS